MRSTSSLANASVDPGRRRISNFESPRSGSYQGQKWRLSFERSVAKAEVDPSTCHMGDAGPRQQGQQGTLLFHHARPSRIPGVDDLGPEETLPPVVVLDLVLATQNRVHNVNNHSCPRTTSHSIRLIDVFVSTEPRDDRLVAVHRHRDIAVGFGLVRQLDLDRPVARGPNVAATLIKQLRLRLVEHSYKFVDHAERGIGSAAQIDGAEPAVAARYRVESVGHVLSLPDIGSDPGHLRRRAQTCHTERRPTGGAG